MSNTPDAGEVPNPAGPSCTPIPVPSCPLCSASVFEQVREVESWTVQRCTGCGLQFTHPQPSDADLAAIYGADYFLGVGDPVAQAHGAALKRATADHYLDLIDRRAPPPGRQLLEVGSGHGDFLARAIARGFEATGIEYSAHACATVRARVGPGATVLQGEIDAISDRPGTFDLCVLNDVIEHVRRPMDFLRRVNEALRPGGVVFIATPSVDSWSARLLGRRWMEYKAEHLTYFSRTTLPRTLRSAGFEIVHLGHGKKILSIDYVTDHFVRYPVALVTPALRGLRWVLPASWRRRGWRIVASGIVALARKSV